MEKYYCKLHSFLDGDENCPDCKSGRVELPVKPARAGKMEKQFNKNHNYFKRFWMAYNQMIKNNVAAKYNFPTLWSKIVACHRFTKLNWDC